MPGGASERSGFAQQMTVEAERPLGGVFSPEIETALTSLTPGEREVIALRIVLDFDAEHVARLLRISRSACSMRLARALQKLEERDRISCSALKLIAPDRLEALLSGAFADTDSEASLQGLALKLRSGAPAASEALRGSARALQCGSFSQAPFPPAAATCPCPPAAYARNRLGCARLPRRPSGSRDQLVGHAGERTRRAPCGASWERGRTPRASDAFRLVAGCAHVRARNDQEPEGSAREHVDGASRTDAGPLSMRTVCSIRRTSCR